MEVVLSTAFKAITTILVDQQLKAIREALTADGQDAALQTKINAVLTADGSLAACAQLICLSLCNRNALEGYDSKINFERF